MEDQSPRTSIDLRRDEYYKALDQPRATEAFVGKIRARMEASLAAVDDDLLTKAQVTLVTSKTGKARISLTPLDAQPEPSTIAALTAALVERWPMTNLLYILKETELRVHFTDTLRTVGARETLDGSVLRRRLLLCLYGLGTNAGLKRMCSSGGEVGYDDLQYVQRRYITKDQLRASIASVCNAIFRSRKPEFWGEGTAACASNFQAVRGMGSEPAHESHIRYGGRGVMIYWHVEKNSVCIYSQ